mgnify:CR=1 FL=1
MDDLSLAAKAYGILWRSITDNAYANEARRVLRDGLEEADRRAGVAWAIETYGAMTNAELAAADMRSGEFPRRMA